MPSLFAFVCCLLLLPAAFAHAGDSWCPQPAPVVAALDMEATPTDEAYHQAMQQAMASAAQLDWVDDPAAGNACGGYYLPPANPAPDRLLPAEQAELRLAADAIHQDAGGVLELAGNVELYQGRRRLRCDTLRLDRQRQHSELSGNIQLREPGLLLLSETAVLDGEQQQGLFTGARYLLHEQQAHGYSQRIELDGGEFNRLRLYDSSFSLCPPSRPHWSFSARELELDEESGRGVLRSAFFRLADVPVLYLPYLDFPIDDRRKTGFLWPAISGQDGGIDIAVPYYLNLAPHYDMTYTPRINSRHGYLHNLELRYKQRYSEWALGGSYIHDDRRVGDVATDDDSSLDPRRWLAFVQQEGRFNANWQSRIDYQSVSDIHYFRDWGTTGLDVQKALNIRRSALLRFDDEHWLASAELVDYQNLEYDPLTGTTVDEDYRRLPTIELAYRYSLTPFRLQPRLASQYTYFHHDTRLRGQRLFAEPAISLPLLWPALSIVPVAGVKYTGFALDGDNDSSLAMTADGVYRGRHDTAVANLAIDQRLHLEHHSAAGRYALTPRLFYYYADYKDQDDLPNFDTESLAFSYQQLWRDSRFTGYDRISDANQLSLGVDNQWRNRHGRTMFDLGIGQTVFFADRRVAAHAGDNDYLLFDGTETAAEYRIKQQVNTQIERDYYRRYSDVALQANWYLDSVHALRSDLVWDPYDSKTRSAAIALHYRDEQARIANLAWRMKRQPGAIASDGSYVDMTVNQLDGSFYLPLNASWHTFLRANVDIEREELIESIVGLRYESCCWAVMTAFKRERKTFENNSRIPDTAAFDYQQSWYIQFELKGLGGVTNTIRRLLEESIQGFE